MRAAPRVFGAILIVAGLGLCAAAVLHYWRGYSAQSEGKAEFEQRLARAFPSPVPSPIPSAAPTAATPAFENPGIVSTAVPTVTPAPAYPFGEPLARLRIPVAQIDCVVFGGSDQATLEKGPGHVPGTALPGSDGPPNNCVITAHRDSHFRHLGWLQKGHTIQMQTLAGEMTYRIVERRIVKPDAVSVLAATPEPRLTLITCYPFNYIGPAPERLVLIAIPVVSSPVRHRS
jgi:sortase A